MRRKDFQIDGNFWNSFVLPCELKKCRRHRIKMWKVSVKMRIRLRRSTMCVSMNNMNVVKGCWDELKMEGRDIIDDVTMKWQDRRAIWHYTSEWDSAKRKIYALFHCNMAEKTMKFDFSFYFLLSLWRTCQSLCFFLNFFSYFTKIVKSFIR